MLPKGLLKTQHKRLLDSESSTCSYVLDSCPHVPDGCVKTEDRQEEKKTEDKSFSCLCILDCATETEERAEERSFQTKSKPTLSALDKFQMCQPRSKRSSPRRAPPLLRGPRRQDFFAATNQTNKASVLCFDKGIQVSAAEAVVSAKPNHF